MRLGITLGEPAGPGQPALCHLYGNGSPASQTNLDATAMTVASCSIGSLYTDYAGAHLWIKTAMPSGAPGGATANGSWTQIV